MSLSEYQPETLTVTAKKVSFEVRGLSFIDMSSLLRTHMDDLESLFTMYENEANNISFGNAAMARYMTRLIADAPGLVAHIIALAADEPEMVNNARRLPLLVQVDALKKIGTLTFEEAGGAKKLFDQVMNLVKEMTPPAPTSKGPNRRARK